MHQNIRTARPLTYQFIVWKDDASLPAMFNLLCSSTNQLLFKMKFCNQSNHYENYGRFNGPHHVPTTKSTLLVVNEDEWYTKEGCAKSMKDTLYAQQYGKRHLSGWSDIEQQKIRPVALAIVELHESEGIRQAGSLSVSRKFRWINFFLKFCSNFLKAFRINLKAFLGLVLPNQYCHIVM